jgi:hypothetical protein
MILQLQVVYFLQCFLAIFLKRLTNDDVLSHKSGTVIILLAMVGCDVCMRLLMFTLECNYHACCVISCSEVWGCKLPEVDSIVSFRVKEQTLARMLTDN